MFKLWSDTKPEAKKELKPNLGLRGWDELRDDEKVIIWQYLEWHFFDKDIKARRDSRYEEEYEFYGDYSEKEARKKRIFMSIATLNEKYKAKNYAPIFLEDIELNSACHDFFSIFMHQQENVVMELLSFYCRAILLERAEKEPYRNENETDKELGKRTAEWRYYDFDKFSKRINEIFEDFGVNVMLSRQGFIPRQEKHITEDIYVPVLKFLANNKWQKVNEHFSEAFNEHRRKNYSTSITHTVSAIQAFLQILVNKKTGKGAISKLIKTAQSKKLIPNDAFSVQVFKNIESVFARDRKEKGMAHPRVDHPSEANSRLLLNLAMVFIQHCIQKKK